MYFSFRMIYKVDLTVITMRMKRVKKLHKSVGDSNTYKKKYIYLPLIRILLL